MRCFLTCWGWLRIELLESDSAGPRQRSATRAKIQGEETAISPCLKSSRLSRLQLFNLFLLSLRRSGIGTDSSCVITRGVMRRFRALLLLATLLTTPVSILAASVFPVSECCCCSGAMCPMHHSEKSQQDKMPCHGTGQSQPTCMCAPSQQAQPARHTSRPYCHALRILSQSSLHHQQNQWDPRTKNRPQLRLLI